MVGCGLNGSGEVKKDVNEFRMAWPLKTVDTGGSYISLQEK